MGSGMAEEPSGTLDQIESGSRVLVDAAIFIYHFTGTSPECRRLLERCEQGDLEGVASVLTLAEVAHRLMTIEAVADGHVSAGNVVKKLRSKPDIVRRLHRFREQVAKIPLMGISVLPLELTTFLRADRIYGQAGLLTNDALIAATAAKHRIEILASGDRDFERLEGLRLYRPSDIGLASSG